MAGLDRIIGRAVLGGIPAPVVRAFIALNANPWAAAMLNAAMLNKVWLPIILPTRPEREIIAILLVVAGVVLFFVLIARWAMRDPD